VGAVRPALTAALAGLALAAAPAAAVEVPGCAPAAPGGDWTFYGGTLDNHRDQLAEETIDAGNAADLGVAWQAPTPDGGVIHSVPTVADGCVFFGTDLGTVSALNADTGEVVWTRSLVDGGGGSGTFQGAGIVGAPAIADGRVHVGVTTPDASVALALDQVTGAVLWQTAIDTDSGGGVDSSPVPFNGMIFQAYQGDESSNHSNPGYAILDAATGAILEARKVLPAADFEAGDRGGSIVNTPAVDLAAGYLYAGTGNPASRRQNPRTDSQIKIDVDPARETFGDIVDEVRGTSDSYPAPTDIDSPVCQPDLQWPIGRFTCGSFDYNFLSSGVLVEHSDGRELFGELQKSGVFQTVDRATMDVVWKATIGAPGLGFNLSSAAADENAIYVAVTFGNLYALDIDTGAVKWVTPGTGVMRFNGLSVANGVLYSTNDLGALQAFDTATGAPLLTDPYLQHTQQPMQDLGNSSGISVARNTVYVSSKDPNSTSTLFAYRLGDGGGGGGGPALPPTPEPPGGVPAPATIVTGPAAANYGYVTAVMLSSAGGAVSYLNGDIARHNVVSTAKGPDGQPLFRSELAGTGQTVPVVGADKVAPGTYEFYCAPHPGMKGQLIVQ
jgi:polyvinyl alcohol dehydrogenase (cytochrome)